MVVGLLTIELFIPGSQSLKEKRMVLRRIKDRVKKFNIAVSEVEHHDLWQRAGIAVVIVSTDRPEFLTWPRRRTTPRFPAANSISRLAFRRCRKVPVPTVSPTSSAASSPRCSPAKFTTRAWDSSR